MHSVVVQSNNTLLQIKIIHTKIEHSFYVEPACRYLWLIFDSMHTYFYAYALGD